MKIFLAPRSNETSYKNFLSTIENGVDRLIVEPYLDDEGKTILVGQDKVFAWGNKESKKSSWDKMEIGDLVLFYKKGEFVYAGELLFKQHSKELGLSLWPPKPGQEPWTCVFFMKNLRPVYIPIADIREAAGYSAGFIVQGFQPLDDKGTKKLIEKFGSIEQFLRNYATPIDKVDKSSDIEEANEVTAHAEAQMLLLRMGCMLGYETYCPNKVDTAFDEILQDYITLSELPTRYLGDEIVKLVRQIDVIWFEDEVPKYAFEVEHSTKMGSGMQRLLQLCALKAKLFLIAPNSERHLFDKFINADPYFKHRDEFHFRDYGQLEKFFHAVSEFKAINDTFLEKIK